MNDQLPVPRFFVEDHSGPLRYMEEEDEDDDADVGQDELSPPAPSPSSIIPNTPRNAAESSRNFDFNGDDAVFPSSASAPLLRRDHNRRQPMRMDRVHSAPTLMEHEVGLALRNISDDFNNSYNQTMADRTRRASHPDTNNHHSRGFIDGLRRQFSRRSRTSSGGDDVSSQSSGTGMEVSPSPSPVTQPGGSRLSQRLRIQSVPEEDEEDENEAVDMNSRASN